MFSSAAALTLGRATVPVYEIYKVGVDPYWLEGLDLLAEVGLNVAVIPHYDNAEGGNHDTRFCYLGERRLAMLEPELPGRLFRARHRRAHRRRHGSRRRHRRDRRQGRRHPAPRRRVRPHRGRPDRPDRHPPRRRTTARASLRLQRTGSDLGPTPAEATAAREKEQSARATTERRLASPSPPRSSTRPQFDAALDARDADGAVAAILELESAIVEWSRDTLQSDDIDRARAALRSMIVRLGAAATEGVRDVREVLGPVVEAALAARVVARSEKAFAVSDAIRDQLADAGIEVRDTPDGAEWLIADG